MKELSTGYGRAFIGPREHCFRTAVFLAAGQRGKLPGARPFTWALTGGSTPKEWYQWCVAKDALSPPLLATTHWFTSDERAVPLGSPESNFGNADRSLLTPLKVKADHKHPWPVDLPAGGAAAQFATESRKFFAPGKCFDVCFLGVGDDGHTASIFPGSPLLDDRPEHFAAVNVPGKGDRLTITPAGLRACGLIVVMALGAGKADILHRILAGPLDVAQLPAQGLRECSASVVWLIDEAAAARFL